MLTVLIFPKGWNWFYKLLVTGPVLEDTLYISVFLSWNMSHIKPASVAISWSNQVQSGGPPIPSLRWPFGAAWGYRGRGHLLGGTPLELCPQSTTHTRRITPGIPPTKLMFDNEMVKWQTLSKVLGIQQFEYWEWAKNMNPRFIELSYCSINLVLFTLCTLKCTSNHNLPNDEDRKLYYVILQARKVMRCRWFKRTLTQAEQQMKAYFDLMFCLVH